MIHPNASDTTTVRSVFVIGPDKKIKLTLTYPQSTGRNFDEILRVIDSLQLTANHKVSTPVNWKQGEDVIIVPAVSDDEARERFPDGWVAVKPYLRDRAGAGLTDWTDRQVDQAPAVTTPAGRRPAAPSTLR